VEQRSRSDRLESLVAQARRLIELARPTTAYLLRILDRLTADDIDELGKWNLDKPKSEAIVDRLTAELGEHRQVVREVLSRCLQFDAWGDYSDRNAALRQRFLESGEDSTTIDRLLGKPPTVYPYLEHFIIGAWHPEREECGRGLVIEDDRRAAICEGYLVAKGMAFQTDLDLLETSARQEWRKWRLFWKWF
jgi:hypothetical protein